MDSSIDLHKLLLDSGVSNVLDQLDAELVGLRPVKTRIREIAALLLVERAREAMEIKNSKPSLHMSFTGHPGTGKTTVASKISEILQRFGYLNKGHVISVTRDDLVGQYVGHTAPKTKEVIKRARGGVLFIDEAYYLFKPGNETDFGSESLEILLQAMENQRNDFVVILAGYKDLMDKFYKSNQGLYSRITHHIDFPDYSESELLQIADIFLRQYKYVFSKDARNTFLKYIVERKKLPFFANARSMRNAIDRSRMRQANRLFSLYSSEINSKQLMTIESSDILASRVFKGEIDGGLCNLKN
tara:strand:- start:746 stop:1648 length:903 start_codon:yes stop_codon:yes gene_type:complete